MTSQHRKLVVATVIAVVLPIGGCGSSGSTGSSDSQTITGSVTVENGHFMDNGTTCTPYESPVKQGATVYVKDGSGSVLGTGPLSGGLIVPNPLSSTAKACQYKFNIPNVKTQADQYAISVEDSKGTSFSKQDMQSNGWKAELTV